MRSESIQPFEPSKSFSRLNIPESGISIPLPDGWRYDNKKARHGMHIITPEHMNYMQNYSTYFVVSIFENGFTDMQRSDVRHAFVENILKGKTFEHGHRKINWDGVIGQTSGSSRSIVEVINHEDQKIAKRWEFAKVVLNHETGSYYSSLFSTRLAECVMYQDVAEELIHKTSFNLKF